MTHEELTLKFNTLLAATKDMREKQKTYFSTRQGWALAHAKTAEYQVDQLIKQEEEFKKSQQTELFNG